jgi:hypothetical protein
MAIDASGMRTRRGILAGAFGGLAAWAASAVGHTLPVRAADGPVILATDNTETKSTRILNSGTDSAFEAWNAAETVGGGISAGGSGVTGENQTPGGCGIWGRSQGNGVGVFGWSQAVGTEFGIQLPTKTGIFGRAIQDATAIGVRGESTSGRGVQGTATTGFGVRASAAAGTGVYATATTGTAVYAATGGLKSGTALRTVGKVRFDNSVGIATVAAGNSSITVTPGIDLTATSAVVATLQGPAGGALVARVSTNATTDKFTIYLTRSTTVAAKVAWHVFG